MQNLAHIDLSELYDLLAQHTSRYMKMLSLGAASRQEFDQCRDLMISIQAEIHSRKAKPQSPGTGGFQAIPLRRKD